MTTATEYTCSIGTSKKYEVGTLITNDSQAFIVTAWKHVGTRRFFTYLRTPTQAELVNIAWNRKTNRFQWVVASN